MIPLAYFYRLWIIRSHISKYGLYFIFALPKDFIKKKKFNSGEKNTFINFLYDIVFF